MSVLSSVPGAMTLISSSLIHLSLQWIGSGKTTDPFMLNKTCESLATQFEGDYFKVISCTGWSLDGFELIVLICLSLADKPSVGSLNVADWKRNRKRKLSESNAGVAQLSPVAREGFSSPTSGQLILRCRTKRLS